MAIVTVKLEIRVAEVAPGRVCVELLLDGNSLGKEWVSLLIWNALAHRWEVPAVGECAESEV